MAERLLITGCARSGTGFVSQVLSSLGLECGHERVFRRTGRKPWGALRADSSWYAVAWLPQVRKQGGIRIVHLVRDPLACARSHLSIEFFRLPPTKIRAVSHDLVRRVCPRVLDLPTELDRFAAHWVAWNRAARNQAHVTVRLEDLSAPVVVRELLAPLGARSKGRATRRTLEAHRGYNGQPKRHESLTWGDLAETLDGPELIELARELGYEPPVL